MNALWPTDTKKILNGIASLKEFDLSGIKTQPFVKSVDCNNHCWHPLKLLPPGTFTCKPTQGLFPCLN